MRVRMRVKMTLRLRMRLRMRVSLSCPVCCLLLTLTIGLRGEWKMRKEAKMQSDTEGMMKRMERQANPCLRLESKTCQRVN